MINCRFDLTWLDLTDGTYVQHSSGNTGKCEVTMIWNTNATVGKMIGRISERICTTVESWKLLKRTLLLGVKGSLKNLAYFGRNFVSTWIYQFFRFVQKGLLRFASHRHRFTIRLIFFSMWHWFFDLMSFKFQISSVCWLGDKPLVEIRE